MAVISDVECAATNCHTLVYKGYKFCSKLCRLYGQMKGAVDLPDVQDPVWEARCIMCGWSVERLVEKAAEWNRAVAYRTCPNCRGTLTVGRCDVGGLGNIPTQEAHRTRVQAGRYLPW